MPTQTDFLSVQKVDEFAIFHGQSQRESAEELHPLHVHSMHHSDHHDDDAGDDGRSEGGLVGL